MYRNQWITRFAFVCVTFVAVNLVSADGGHRHHGGHGQDHGHGGGRNQTQCYQAQQFFNQWWPQSALIGAFQTACRQVGTTQAWSVLQSLLDVLVTGALDQATFQALLNNGNHALLAQQLVASLG